MSKFTLYIKTEYVIQKPNRFYIFTGNYVIFSSVVVKLKHFVQSVLKFDWYKIGKCKNRVKVCNFIPL